MFKHRATKPERIDTGDYAPEEYRRFLREIRFINQRLGDRRALERTLLADISNRGLKKFSVLDVGAGTGELLGVVESFAKTDVLEAFLVGLDLNELSVHEIAASANEHECMSTVRGDALELPFGTGAFDYVICSLFTHHLTDEQISRVLPEMSRVARLGILVIDLERSPAAWFLYQLFCAAFRISPLVRQDGSLSIRKGFKVEEFESLSERLGLVDARVMRSPPYRVVLSTF